MAFGNVGTLSLSGAAMIHGSMRHTVPALAGSGYQGTKQDG
jgi:hypothetical protein